jgi:rhamnosyltransferase
VGGDLRGRNQSARGASTNDVTTAPSISIVVPTFNGAATLPGLLEAIAQQRVGRPFEVVAIDSGSTDGSVGLLRASGARLIAIPAGTFNHGLTRNLGIEASRGELVVLIVQDAVPASDTWLAALTRPLAQDSCLAGTFARQLPRPDAGALTRHYLARWFASSDRPRTAAATRTELDALPPLARLDRCTFDNVCSCVRRSVWQQHPFRETPIGEDVEWARDVLLSGYRIAYVPEAAVIHSHERTAAYEFERTRVLHQRLFELFGVRTIPTPFHLVRAIASCLITHLRCERSARAAALAVAWPLGQYIGAHSGVRGRRARQSRTA